MNEHLWKLVLVVALSHAYRVVGRTVGPRWAGLITALPCSTAIALVSSGGDRGVSYAVTMADACWVGLAAASTLPLAFASAVVAGWGLCRTAALAVFSYFAVLVGVGMLAHPLGGNLPASLVVLCLATTLATRIVEPLPSWGPPRRIISSAQVFWLRTAVPALCLAGVLTLGEQFGPNAAGYLGAFPGVTLTGLLLTSVESGPTAAVRMARALPLGNWAMVAFLATFAQVAMALGLLAGTLLAYLAAVVCLVLIARMTASPSLPELRDRLVARRQLRWEGGTLPDAPRGWPRTPRRFSPLIESIAA